MCGGPAGGGRRKAHDLHLGGCQAGDDRKGVDVLHYDYSPWYRGRKEWNRLGWVSSSLIRRIERHYESRLGQKKVERDCKESGARAMSRL
jgi:hypothetical protein